MGPCLNSCDESSRCTISFKSYFYFILLQPVCVFSPAIPGTLCVGQNGFEGKSLIVVACPRSRGLLPRAGGSSLLLFGLVFLPGKDVPPAVLTSHPPGSPVLLARAQTRGLGPGRPAAGFGWTYAVNTRFRKNLLMFKN